MTKMELIVKALRLLIKKTYSVPGWLNCNSLSLRHSCFGAGFCQNVCLSVCFWYKKKDERMMVGN